ncbi:MAG: hypothetical protein ABJO01_01035 [Parasphingorhabdus sp.]|uniref:hypothetical protein n=1 Tax=Parasphingorhabdus sp. TaxID=2709688 RepID=UPI00329A3664
MKQKTLTALALTVSGLAFFPSSSHATFTEPRAQDQDIIVTGKITTKDAIAEFVQATIATPKGGRYEGQYARFSNAVCPKVVGLSASNKQQVEKRMRGIALAADMQVAREKCTPNIFVIVVADGNEAINLIRKKKSRLFGGIAPHQRDQIARSGGPTYAWKRIQTGSAESGALQNSDETDILPSDEIDKTEVATMQSNVKSNIKRTTKQAMTHSFLLMERDALINLTTVQIADYAAMRSYIDTRNSKTRKAPRYSILSLFDQKGSDENIPASASEMDLVLLSSLYNSPSDVSASMQSAAMLHRIEKELTAGKAK